MSAVMKAIKILEGKFANENEMRKLAKKTLEEWGCVNVLMDAVTLDINTEGGEYDLVLDALETLRDVIRKNSTVPSSADDEARLERLREWRKKHPVLRAATWKDSDPGELL